MQKRKTICFITSMPESLHQKRAAKGIFAQCEKYGYNVAVFGTMIHLYSVRREYMLGEINIYRLMNFDRFDGIIIDTNPLTGDQTGEVCDMLRARLQNSSTPVVALESPLGEYPVLQNHNEPILREMVRHIAGVHGCRDILLLTGKKDNDTAESRLTIYQDELKKYGIETPPERIVYGDFWYTSGEALADRILSGEISMPEAVIAASDHMALGLMGRLTENGVRIPEDLIVLGFEASAEALCNEIPLSSYEANDVLSAADAVDALRRQIDPGAEILPYQTDYQEVFHPGVSCGCNPDFATAGHAFHDALYQMQRNYSAKSLLENIDIGLLMESYVAETFTSAETPEDCLREIVDSIYLLNPYESFYLCLKDDWLDIRQDMSNGYPAQMKTVIAVTSTGEFSNYREKDAILFDTEEMLPRMFEPSETPSVFYFSPVHFSDKMLGYAVLQRSLHNTYMFNLVYRNWLRFVTNALQMIRVQKRLMQLSVRDEMTGALNRRGMYAALERMLAEAPPDAKVFASVIDMDGLKYINDTFGHEEGDFGIRTVSRAAAAMTAENEIFVRAGGDEFFILGIGNYTEADIAKRIAAFEKEITARSKAAGKPYMITASIGCAIYPASRKDAADEALRDADIAMYRYKTERKRNRKT